MRLRSLRTWSVLSVVLVPWCGCSEAKNAPGMEIDSATEVDGSDGTDAQVDDVVPVTPTPVRIANFNARDVFNDKKDGEDWLIEELVLSASDYRKKLSAVARIVAKLDADIVSLQEIENKEVLDALAEHPEIGREYPYRVLVPGNDPRGIDVAVLSTVPFSDTATHKKDLFAASTAPGEEYRYSRDCLEVHFDVAGRDVVLLNIHFKAKSEDNPNKRLAEAEHTRQIVNAMVVRDPSAAVLVLGDFNDSPDSEPVSAIRGNGEGVMSNAASLVPDAQAWTVESTFTGERTLHDDQWANPTMARFRTKDSVVIWHDSDFGNAEMAETSDHSPVVATYVIE